MPQWCASVCVPDILLHNTTKYLRNLSEHNILVKFLVKFTIYRQKTGVILSYHASWLFIEGIA